MVRKDGWRVREANEAWVRIKTAKGWSGATDSLVHLAGNNISINELNQSYLRQIGTANFKETELFEADRHGHTNKYRGTSDTSKML